MFSRWRETQRDQAVPQNIRDIITGLEDQDEKVKERMEHCKSQLQKRNSRLRFV